MGDQVFQTAQPHMVNRENTERIHHLWGYTRVFVDSLDSIIRMKPIFCTKSSRKDVCLCLYSSQIRRSVCDRSDGDRNRAHERFIYIFSSRNATDKILSCLKWWSTISIKFVRREHNLRWFLDYAWIQKFLPYLIQQFLHLNIWNTRVIIIISASL